MRHVLVTRDAIDTQALLSSVSAPAHGAAVLFIGTVREQNDGRAVRGMRYDAYEAMALEVLQTIVDEAAALLDGGRIAAVHRIGELAIGDVSIAVAAAAPHRAPTFDAARHVIEEVKRRLPVWKQEHYITGDAVWLDGSIPPVGHP